MNGFFLVCKYKRNIKRSQIYTENNAYKLDNKCHVSTKATRSKYRVAFVHKFDSKKTPFSHVFYFYEITFSFLRNFIMMSNVILQTFYINTGVTCLTKSKVCPAGASCALKYHVIKTI